MQSATPAAVGSRAASRVQRRLLVSLWMVSSVVEHGQWNKEKRIMLTAVRKVHPWEMSKSFMEARLLISVRVPWER